MAIPDTSRAAVFLPDEKRFELRRFPLHQPKADEVLVKVSLACLCGSDIHTVTGRRHPPGPIVLGHEICGSIAAAGVGVMKDFAGATLRVGDRVTWSIMARCGRCFFCTHGLPQKCESLFKYGHESIATAPSLSGGFAEYVYLVPGTAILRLPDHVPDHTAAFANCSLATMCAAVRTLGIGEGDRVLIQGAGLVGLCASALCSAAGAAVVAVTDATDERLERAKAFGATHTCNVRKENEEETLSAVAGPRGFDAGIEVCGVAAAVPVGLRALRIGGRYLTAGCVFPGATAVVDFQWMTTRLLQLIGLHNYTPEDLARAVAFVAENREQFPWGDVVGKTFGLGEIDEAVAFAQADPEVLRVGVEP